MNIVRKLIIDIETGKELFRECYEYEGPIELCIRAAEQEADAAGKTASQNAATYGANAAAISANTTPFLTREMTNPQGESQRDIGAQLTSSLSGTGGATAGLTGAAGKMAAGTRNPMGFSSALDQAAMQRDKGTAQTGEKVAAENAQVKLGQQQQGAQGLDKLYGMDVGAQTANESLVSQDILARMKASQNGWIQNWGAVANDVTDSVNAAQSVMGMFAGCPAEGSMYLMADGTEKPVETLVTGEIIMGVDGEPQTIEEIESGEALILEVKTEDGHTARNSRVHAFILGRGGFTVASSCLGKQILTEFGPSKVVSVKLDGTEKVFNVITNGSHSYRADGVWALGVGEAERHVSMGRWNEIADGIELGEV